jgi:2-oxoglutarate dehydrogenase E1 component
MSNSTLSYLSNAEVGSIDALYQQYRQDPNSVAPDWKQFFEGFDFALAQYPSKVGANGQAKTADIGAVQKEINVLNLITAYRVRGHLFAKINPILPRPDYKPNLDLSNFNLSEADLDTPFHAGSEVGLGTAKLRDIIAHLQQTYCGPIGVEYRFIRIPEIINWMQQRMEPTKNTPHFSPAEKKYILKKLGQATTFESYLHRKFVGQKRFSLEGAEALIPALDGVIEFGAQLGIKEFVLGMAHRGRLNVLTNIMKKEYDQVFGEFEGKGLADSVFDGDVKYHMGFSSDPELAIGKKVHLSLAPNPSHLECVNPVVIGMARAKMDNMYGGDHDLICPILIHGDASVAGQGVVYETIQMSRLDGYQVGGAIHIVINNQVGFTTSQKDARSSTYCTDVGKVTLSPVFHVNGDDPEALAYVTKMAMAFRQEFNRDVFIDIICYRKYGHNEGDEPRFTQPVMYKAIEGKKNSFQVYADKLMAEGTITADELKKLETDLANYLDKEYQESKAAEVKALDTTLHRHWVAQRFYDDDKVEPNPKTQVGADLVRKIAAQVTKLPADLTAHPNLVKLMQQRADMIGKTDKIDWGMGETLAYGSLLLESFNVRITGQDVERGTFSHRHAVLKDMGTERMYAPLNNIEPGQGTFYIFNSLLSEFAVMGFEYGYASAAPYSLTIWEAQFGDFVNGAQTIIDQFLSACKTKWQRMNGLVLLLPHGYEGQGPEHSSARPERFLDLCAQNNMYVCNFTSPANFFHALRRQLLTPYRRPLVVMTPKSLLRHPKCVSGLSEFTSQNFVEVYDDGLADPKKVTRLVFTWGKIYYDLLEQRDAFKKDDTALIRIEQMYPFPKDQLMAIIKKYNKAKNFIWCQEEPENMGGWPFVLRKWREVPLELVSRKESASPATGSGSQHQKQQQYLVKKALDLAPDAVLVKA